MKRWVHDALGLLVMQQVETSYKAMRRDALRFCGTVTRSDYETLRCDTFEMIVKALHFDFIVTVEALHPIAIYVVLPLLSFQSSKKTHILKIDVSKKNFICNQKAEKFFN